LIRLLSGWVLALAAAPAAGVDSVELAVEALDGEGFRAEALRLELRPGEGRHAVLVEADALYLGEDVILRRVRAECPALRLQGLGGECPEGRIRFDHPWLGPRTVPARFSYAHPGRLDLHLMGLVIADAPVDLRVRLDGADWTLEATGEGLDLEAAAGLSAAAGWPLPVSLNGLGGVSLSARGHGASLRSARLAAAVSDMSFTSDDGLRAGEEVKGELALSLQREGADYGLALQARWQGGGAYLHPVFVEAGEFPLQLSLAGRFEPLGGAMRVERLDLDHPGVLRLSGRGSWVPADGLSALEATLELDRMELPAAYETYAQPYLPGTALDVLDTRGLLAGRAVLREGAVSEAVINASRVDVDDRAGRFAIHGLDAALHWRADGAAPVSRVAIDGGHVYGIPLGASRFQPVIGRDGFHLPEPVHLPVLDGALEIRDLRAAGLGGEDTRWQFDGGLTPVSLELLTGILGWPPLSGTLAGIIPDVRYERGVLVVGGRLLVRAFDGSVTLGDLRLRDPFGVAPEFAAQIAIRDIDLAQLTRTFDFGRITGRLEGDVRDLVLVRWSPVQFDAVLRTPPGDTSPRRISQRAVDNLTRIGGGVGGVLSGGFMRFFEEFNYRQLGLSCRLAGEVCHMDGVAPAQQGYYIVQGAGLPRIDVIGFTREVAWRDLVARLAVILQEGGGPEVR
jgi:hypothetical protein